MIPQGFPLFAEQGGRRYLVVGWLNRVPFGVPVDAPGGHRAASELVPIPVAATWSTPEPARELVAEVSAIIDRAEWFDSPADRFTELTKTLRALLASWS